ncbi:MAG: hypothetical protein JSW43_04320 [Gemmatimonadota bacterium]|nr:MAG: hypothetical protein JSW43_04320 [Gemmatimonadota bacterium]
MSSISILGPDVVTLSPGETSVLELIALDARGRQLDTALQASWKVEIPARASVQDGRIAAGEQLGHTWVFAAVADLQDSVAVWVQKPEHEPSAFRITLLWDEEVPAWWREALTTAARRWEQVIRDTLPSADVATLTDYCEMYDAPTLGHIVEGVEHGVRIHVTVSDAFPPATYVEAVGGVCMHRGLPQPTTVLGKITLNRFWVDAGMRPHRLSHVAHHEMGHTLGLVGLVQGHQPPWLQADVGEYRGHLALYGHLLDEGRTVRVLSYLDGMHWSLRELMGTTPSYRIGNVSVGSLMDFGYPAAWYGAGEVSTTPSP